MLSWYKGKKLYRECTQLLYICQNIAIFNKYNGNLLSCELLLLSHVALLCPKSFWPFAHFLVEKH